MTNTIALATALIMPPNPLVLSPDFIDTNSVVCTWSPSPDTNATMYGLALGTNSGSYLFTNWYGDATNAELTSVIPLPWYLVVIAGDNEGDFSPPSNEIGWNGTMIIDVTNYVTLAFIYTFTNPVGNNFFRVFESSDLAHWSDTGMSPIISNHVTSITTNAPMP